MTPAPPKQEENNTATKAPLSTIAVVVAIALIVVYLGGLVIQWGQLDAQEIRYGRGLHLLGGLEALAFAAAGALFGNAVQRQVTDSAEKKAADEKRRADENERGAEGGRALARLARAKETGTAQGARSFGSADAQGAVRSEMGELLDVAKQYGL